MKNLFILLLAATSLLSCSKDKETEVEDLVTFGTAEAGVVAEELVSLDGTSCPVSALQYGVNDRGELLISYYIGNVNYNQAQQLQVFVKTEPEEQSRDGRITIRDIKSRSLTKGNGSVGVFNTGVTLEDIVAGKYRLEFFIIGSPNGISFVRDADYFAAPDDPIMTVVEVEAMFNDLVTSFKNKECSTYLTR